MSGCRAFLWMFIRVSQKGLRVNTRKNLLNLHNQALASVNSAAAMSKVWRVRQWPAHGSLPPATKSGAVRICFGWFSVLQHSRLTPPSLGSTASSLRDGEFGIQRLVARHQVHQHRPPAAPPRPPGPPFAADHRMFLPLASELPAGYEVVLRDIRGYGRSIYRNPSLHTYSRYAADIVALLDHLEVFSADVGGAARHRCCRTTARAQRARALRLLAAYLAVLTLSQGEPHGTCSGPCRA
jgi:hypothetical protein